MPPELSHGRFFWPLDLSRFPLEGGTGGIWKGVSKLLPQERQRYNQEMTELDREKQVVTFADGRKVGLGLIHASCCPFFGCS
jgi:hypothetical protein